MVSAHDHELIEQFKLKVYGSIKRLLISKGELDDKYYTSSWFNRDIYYGNVISHFGNGTNQTN